MKLFKRLKIGIIFIAIITTVCITANIVLSYWFSSEKLDKLQFNVQKIVVELGDEIDLYDYLDVKPDNAFVELKVTSLNEKIVNSSVNTKALGIGRTHIKASAGGKETSCSVEVHYKEPEKLQLFSYGDLFQAANNIVSVDFSAIVDEYIDPDFEIAWYVNGVNQSAEGKYFSYLPANEPGSNEITAKIDGTEISDSLSVWVYEDIIEIPSAHTVESNESLSFLSDTEGYWEFFVNGESVKHINGKLDWEFLPEEAGCYSVTATFFGLPVMFDNGAFESIFVKAGAIVPSNLDFEYDNCYPDSFISWKLDNVYDDDGFEYYVRIIDGSGGIKDYSSVTHGSLFDGKRFNSSGIIDITKQYTVSVSCEKEGSFSGGNYSSITTKMIPSSALPFLSNKYLDKNYYMTSDSEFFDIYEYLLWMRKDKVLMDREVSVGLTVHMGYTSSYNSNRLSRMAWSRAAQSGLYYLDPPKGSTRKGDTLSLKITFGSDNFPTKQTDIQSKPSTLLVPHVNFKEKSNRALFIDQMPLSKDRVATSNELYYIVERGYRPNLEKGSRAEELYSYAQDVLRDIISESMDELEKIHAIYDWILWRTHYDKKVESIENLNESVKYAPYYLESVLNDEYPFAVCDGLSKTFSLLANMEGIKCIRVVGKANGGANSWGEHAWNKVLYNESWYIVDCTWGDYEVEIDGKIFETASHQFLMLSSGEISATHRENSLGEYPKAAVKPFIFFAQSFTHNGTSAELYFFDSSNKAIKEKATSLVDYVLASKPNSPTYTIGDGANNTTVVEYYGTDFLVPKYLYFKVKNEIENELQKRGIQDSIVQDITGGYVYIIIKYRT